MTQDRSTHSAPAWRRARGSLWLLVAAVAGCQLAGPEAQGPAGGRSTLPAVTLTERATSAQDEAIARRLLSAAEASFEARRFFEVVRTTDEILERFPGSEASGPALLLSARSQLELGAPARADSVAQRYLDLLPANDPRATDPILIQVEARQGDHAGQLDRLLRLPSGAPPTDVAEWSALARTALDSLSPAELDAVLAGAPGGGAVAPVPLARRAVGLLDLGDADEARRVASEVLAAGPQPPERELAEGVLRGELPEGMARVTAFTIATVLPEGGPPAMSEFARAVYEGVEVAASTVLGDEYQVTLLPLDDGADPFQAADLVRELEAEGVTAAIGFLEDETLWQAALAREGGLPIISPTARTAYAAGEGIFSLEGGDTNAAAEIARYAASRAFQRVAIVLPRSESAYEEADAFEAEAARLGVPVVGRYFYQPGATFFQDQLLGAQNALRAAEIAALGLTEDDTLRVEMLEPVGLFLPIPREDVPYLAPQLAHFALDTVAVELMGTSGWTDPQVIETLETRYTNGVVATAPIGTGPNAPGFQRFRDAYEQYFRRSLVSGAPAIGYDAALLMLEALRPGRVRPDQVSSSLGGLDGIEGATGIFSVVDGRLIRRTEVVTIRNRSFVPVPPG